MHSDEDDLVAMLLILMFLTLCGILAARIFWNLIF